MLIKRIRVTDSILTSDSSLNSTFRILLAYSRPWKHEVLIKEDKTRSAGTFFKIPFEKLTKRKLMFVGTNFHIQNPKTQFRENNMSM